MTERWSPAPGLEDRFEVSDQNRIRPVSAPLPTQLIGGQPLVVIDGVTYAVDALAAAAFAAPVPDPIVELPTVKVKGLDGEESDVKASKPVEKDEPKSKAKPKSKGG